MKIALIFFICSDGAGNCVPPHQWPEKFNDMYDCFNAGYEQSMQKLEEIGRKNVNEHEIFIRFACALEIKKETNT